MPRVIGARARMVHKLSRIVHKEIQAEALTAGLNAADPKYDALARRIALRLVDDIKPPCLASQCLVVDDDGAGGYKNPRIVESGCSAEETLYPEDPETLEPVEEAIADYVIPLPDPDFLPEI